MKIYAKLDYLSLITYKKESPNSDRVQVKDKVRFLAHSRVGTGTKSLE